MERQWVIGVVGGLALVAGLVGVLLFEAATAPETELFYPVSWTVNQAGGQERSGTLNETEDERYTFNLSSRNVTHVEVVLRWQDDAGQPDRFNLTVQPPGGQARTASAENGTIRLTFQLNPVPSLRGLTAATRGQAAGELAQAHTGEEGIGTWTVIVELEEAPGQRPVPQAPELETQPDGSNDYRVSFGFSVYRPQIGEPRAPA